MTSSLSIPKGGFQKSKTLWNQLNYVATLEGNEGERERFDIIQGIQNDVEAARFFRRHAPSTQSRQDAHLKKYRHFVYAFLNQNQVWEDVEEEEWRDELFSRDFKNMANKMKMFLIFAFKNAAPRAKAARSIEMQTLCAYRDSLLFWAGYYYRLRDDETLNYRKLFNELMGSMRYVQDKYGEVFKNKSKTWLGLAELRQLFDWEAYTNTNIEYSEQHQVLWCLGRVTALRPGSLCPAARHGRTGPIKWKDFQFFLGDEPGQFVATLGLDHINIKRKQDPTHGTRGAEVSVVPLQLRLPSPQPANIVFSAAHRLLVIAIRRGILQDIDSLDDLFAYDRFQIFVKDRHLNDTVFFRGKPKGDGLDTDHPLASSALTEYLRRRGVQIGYDKPITWYSIRRRAATDMVRRVGLEATRFMLGHSPGSHTLEVYYLNMLAYFDNQGVLLEEGISNNGVSNASSEWHPLALEKLEGAAFQKSRGHALDDLIRRIIHADDYAPGVDADSTEMMNYRRRVKRFAERVLIDREGDWQRRKMKKSDMDERKARLTASKFTDGVVERALESMSQQGSGLEEGRDPDDEQGQQDDSEDTFVSQEDDQAQPEGDLEDVQNEAAGSVDLDEQGRLNMTMDADVDATNDRQLHESSYKALARAAMELWLHNPMSAHTIWRERSAEDKMCPDCKDDDTVDERTRTRPFLSEAKLNDHLGGNFHHPAAKWRRGVEKHFCDRGKFTCPYCFHAGEPEPFTCHEIALLIRHIQESTGEDPSVDHDLLKTDDGWYEPDWEDPLHLQPSAGSQLKYQQKGKREMKKLGIDTTPMPTLLTPEPHASGGALLRGSLPPQPLHARYKDSIVSHPEATALDATIPPHLRGVITTGYNPALSRIPDYLHGVVVRKEKPNSGELDGDEEEGE